MFLPGSRKGAFRDPLFERIYPAEPRKEPNLSYRLLRVIYPAFRVLFPDQVIPAEDLARAMAE
jgi:hypothetical protein